jgi:hypothetical protein
VTLEGRRVRLEPLEPRHEEALLAIAQDPHTWRWMRCNGYEPDEFRRWWASVDMGFGSSRSGTHGPTRRRGGTSANTKAKYLLMRHAFEDEG